MWNVTLYKRTGLNSANTIDKPARLDAAEQLEVPALDILQPEHLSQIRVKATREQVKDTDYCCLHNNSERYYYAVDPFMLSSIDVTTLHITCDSVMTAAAITGDISNVEFGDGITDRYHVRKQDDTYGAYEEEDPLLVPDDVLEFDTYQIDHDNGEGKHLVESTMSLANMAERRQAETYVDEGSETGGGKVVVPQTVPALEFTEVTLSTGGRSYKTPGSEYYDHSFERTQNGIARVRSLGAEGCILNSWIVPAAYCEYIPGEQEGLEGLVLAIQGKEIEDETGVYFDDNRARNKRLSYGSLNKIEIISPASGNSISYNPEDLCQSRSNPGRLVIGIMSDPRPSGRPYFFPKWYRGKTLNERGYAHMLPGLQWSNAPLVYTGNSGADLTQIKYDADRAYRSAQASIQREQIDYNATMAGVNQLLGMGGQAIGAAGTLSAPVRDAYTLSNDPDLGTQVHKWDAMTAFNAANQAASASHSAATSLIGGAYSAAGGLIMNEASAYIAGNMLEKQYRAAANRELQSLALALYVKVPGLAFPRNESLRDFIGNNAVIVKYKISDRSLSKLDKILDMYGYKITATISGDMFKTRSKFNYVSAKGVTITDKRLPLWLRESLAAQIKAGVRVWHQLPDPAAYTDGSNV